MWPGTYKNSLYYWTQTTYYVASEKPIWKLRGDNSDLKGLETIEYRTNKKSSFDKYEFTHR